ncbi:MAG: hypothetical protein RL326_1430 [Pseudomonadota bacterium]|jgi:hypothetical protein
MRRLNLSPTTLVSVIAAVAACFVGVVLDERLRHHDSSSDRLRVRSELFAHSPQQLALKDRIEKLSGLEGRPLLSLDQWVPVEPIVVDGIDVSNLFVGEFSYKPSLEGKFQFSKFVLDAVFTRPETFFDLGVPVESGALVIRFSGSSVEAFSQSSGGRDLVPLDGMKAQLSPGCSRYELLSTATGQSVVCSGRTVMEIKMPIRRNGRVFAASNLTGGELRELSIAG